jgi:hypothetical protein
MSVQIKPAFTTYLWISFFTVDRGSWPWVSTFFRNFILQTARNPAAGGGHIYFRILRIPPSLPPHVVGRHMDLFSLVSWSTGYHASPLKSPYMIIIHLRLIIELTWACALGSLLWASNSFILLTENLSVTVKLFLSRNAGPGILLIRSITAFICLQLEKNKRKSTVSPCRPVNYWILAETHPIDSHMKYPRWQHTWAFEVHWSEGCPKVIKARHKSVSDHIAPNKSQLQAIRSNSRIRIPKQLIWCLPLQWFRVSNGLANHLVPLRS